MPILPAVLALAQFAPSILRFLGVGENGAPKAVLDKIEEVATSVSGATTLDEAVTIFASSQEKAYEFKIRMLANDTEMEKLYLADVQSARVRDTAFITNGKYNHRANIMFILAFAIVAWLFYIVWSDPNINEFAKGVVTLILGRFLGYLDAIYNFEFGSTRSSKEKDATINHLSENK